MRYEGTLPKKFLTQKETIRLTLSAITADCCDVQSSVTRTRWQAKIRQDKPKAKAKAKARAKAKANVKAKTKIRQGKSRQLVSPRITHTRPGLPSLETAHADPKTERGRHSRRASPPHGVVVVVVVVVAIVRRVRTLVGPVTTEG